ncbi:MAG: hypothetical protein WD995_14115 [Gemmatimonadota bacterium]
MSFETTHDREQFRLLNRLFEAFLRTDPKHWDEVAAAHTADPRLVVEARRLLALEQSGVPDLYLASLVRAAQVVLRADAGEHQEFGGGSPS